MKKILIIDTNQGFTSDIERNLIINEIDDIEVYTKNSVDEGLRVIDEIKPDEVVMPIQLLSDGILDINYPVYCYAKSNEDILVAKKASIPCFGIVKRAKDLLDKIELNDVVNMEEPKTKPENRNNKKNRKVEKHNEGEKTNIQSQSENPMFQNPYMQMFNPGVQMTEEQKQYMENLQKSGMMPFMFPMMFGGNIQMMGNGQTMPGQYTRLDSNVNGNQYAPAASVRDMSNMRMNENAREKNEWNDRIAEEEYQRDIFHAPQKARCVTIYSAKGGVGKTTISCELATFLALTSKGRNRFKVCIADFNIDFGDVLNTLSFRSDGPNMTTWAEDIRELLSKGRTPETINYSENQIMTWLQKNEKDGLYALLAPISNADSMDIGEKEIEVMLRNLIENCGFDFVICDTGNNTRDSSFIALEKADDVFLVLTQSVNTANCNNSMLQTCARVGFDMNKISLIINMVKPAKLVGVAPEELVAAFKNPNTGRSYPCVAQIRDNSDVENYGNLGKPLTYNSGHSFTKSIGEIVRYLTQDTSVFELKPPKKKGILSFLAKDKE